MNIKMTSEVFAQIKNSIGSRPSETGGMLGTKDGETIDTFFFDEEAKTTGVLYVPNIDKIKHVLNVEWNTQVPKVGFSGFIHSHPYGATYPSGPDETYAIRIMKSFKIDYFYMPIVQTSQGGKFSIHSYMMVHERGKYELVDATLLVNGVVYDPHHQEGPFSRIESFLNISLLQEATIIGIGCGGGRDYYLDLARSGVGNFILMDGDDISISNIASQGVFQSEIGMSKVEATRKSILDINPEANVIAINAFLDDHFLDDDFEALLGKIPDRSLTMLVGFTDDFKAQARTVHLAMKYQLKYLSALHHDHGSASEIIYWYPGISISCPRCYLEPRYHANLVEGYIKDVTSNSSPVFITRRLDSTCEKITLGMLLYESDPENVLSMFLANEPARNFLLQRHITFAANLFGQNVKKLFGEDPHRFNDDIVWIKMADLDIEPHVCPDCLNQTDPEAIAKSIKDSREIRIVAPEKIE